MNESSICGASRGPSSCVVLCRLILLGVFVAVALTFTGCMQTGYDSPGRKKSDTGRRAASKDDTSGKVEGEETHSTLEQSLKNLVRIGVALQVYHDRYRCFPPAYTTDTQGRPLLSWRVLLLPCLKEQQLYQQFRLNEPWDSPHNKQLLAKIPEVYRTPGSNAPAGTTNYLGVAGPGTIFEGPNSARFADIRDGSANTLIVVEASDQAAVEWTRPEDFVIDEHSTPANLVGLRQGHFIGVSADGRPHPVSAKITAEQLRALATKSGGEMILWQAITYGE